MQAVANRSGLAGLRWFESSRFRHFSSSGGYMTAAELIAACKEYEAQHGILALLSLLEDIIECQAQAAGVELLDIDEDEMTTAYFTVQ